MSDIELKPCPFCGGEAVVHANDGVKVICRECGASSKGLVDVYSQGRPNGGAIKAVVTAWNNRKPMERIVEQIQEVAKNYCDAISCEDNPRGLAYKCKDCDHYCFVKTIIEIVKGGAE